MRVTLKPKRWIKGFAHQFYDLSPSWLYSLFKVNGAHDLLDGDKLPPPPKNRLYFFILVIHKRTTCSSMYKNITIFT